MRIYSAILLIILPLAVLGADQRLSTSTLIINSNKIEIVRSKSGHINMSKNCTRKPTCLALQAQKKARKVQVTEIDLMGGKSLGSVLCQKLNGRNIKIKLSKGKISYCYFLDDSYIESGLLTL